VAHLLQHAEEFAGFVERMSDDELKATFVKPAYGTVERNIEAVIEHGYYHLGQIILLRKQIEKDTAY